MVAVGIFCLMNSFFPGCPGDSPVFQESKLAKLQKEYRISTYLEETPKSTSTKGRKHKSPCPKNTQKSSHKVEEPHKSSSKALETSSPRAPNSISAKSSKTTHLPQAKEHKYKCDHKDCNAHPKTKDQPSSNKGNKSSSDKDGSSTTSQENCKHSHSPDLHASSLECKQKDTPGCLCTQAFTTTSTTTALRALAGVESPPWEA